MSRNAIGNVDKVSFETFQSIEESKDVAFTSEGDLAVFSSSDEESILNRVDFMEHPKGDIGAVTNWEQSVEEQIIIKRLTSDQGEWVLQPRCGASLSSFIGERNNSETATHLKSEIIYSLTYDTFIKTQNLTVEIIPIDHSRVNIVIIVRKDLSRNFKIINFGFSLTENRMIRY